MKAWFVMPKHDDVSTIVFAETRGKARAVALRTEACEDADFCDIEVRRMPECDKCYKEGKREIDWTDPDDVAILEALGLTCEAPQWRSECDMCPRSPYCGLHQALN